MIRLQPEGSQIEMNPTCLPVEWIEIDDHHDHVAQVVGCLAVANQHRIVRAMKAQVADALQCRVLLADTVNAGNDVLQTPRRTQIAMLEFVFLGIQVLFAARLHRRVFAQLKRGPINTIAGAQGSRQNQSDHKRRTATDLKKLRKDVRRVRPEIGAEVFSYLSLRKLGEIVC